MDALTAQSAALGESVGAWSGLQQAASSGRLRMEPGVAEQCAKHCEDLKHKLDGHYWNAQSLQIKSGMGDCIIGNAVTEKFNTKATGPTNSLMSVIRQHQQVLTQMAQTYRAAGQAFRAQDRDNAAELGG